MGKIKDYARRIAVEPPKPVDPLRGRPYGEPAPDDREPGLLVTSGGAYGPGVQGFQRFESPEDREKRLREEWLKAEAAQQAAKKAYRGF